jgi:hypothetical protein
MSVPNTVSRASRARNKNFQDETSPCPLCRDTPYRPTDRGQPNLGPMRPRWRYPVRADGHLLGEITCQVGVRAFEALTLTGISLGMFPARVEAELALGRV